MGLFLKILTAFISSVMLAVIINIIFPPPKNPSVGSVVGDPSSLVFTFSLPVFLVIGVPTSLLIEWIVKKMRLTKLIFLYKIVMYIIAGGLIGGIVILIFPLGLYTSRYLLYLTVGSSLLYYLVLSVVLIFRKYTKKTERTILK